MSATTELFEGRLMNKLIIYCVIVCAIFLFTFRKNRKYTPLKLIDIQKEYHNNGCHVRIILMYLSNTCGSGGIVYYMGTKTSEFSFA